MYELGMSADSRREPMFDIPCEFHEPEAAGAPSARIHAPQGKQPIYLEDDDTIDAASILLRGGIVVAVALAIFGGIKFHEGKQVAKQLASSEARYDWAGRPLTTNDKGDLAWPETDATQTAGVDRIVTGAIKPISKVEERKAEIAETQTRIHVVQSGDTISAIGKKYKISSKELMAFNGIENPRRIKPGMEIRLPR